MGRGRFVTFEGGEGAGKSTQLTRLVEWLRGRGLSVVATREPGGAPAAEAIRRLLVEGETDRWDAVSEALLHSAARREHLRRTVWPALAAGSWVVSDRFADSTLAYQGYGHGLPRAELERLYRFVAGDFVPDLTIVLDLPVAEGLRRAAARRGGEDRYERMDHGFHERLRNGYLTIARDNPDRCAVIDAQGEVEDVAGRVMALVGARLGTG